MMNEIMKKVQMLEEMGIVTEITPILTVLGLVGELERRKVSGGIWADDTYVPTVLLNGKEYGIFLDVKNIREYGLNLYGYCSSGFPCVREMPINAVLIPFVENKWLFDKTAPIIIIYPTTCAEYECKRYSSFAFVEVNPEEDNPLVGRDINDGNSWLGAAEYPTDLTFSEKLNVRTPQYSYERCEFAKDLSTCVDLLGETIKTRKA